MSTSQIRGYSTVQILLHWAIAALVLFQILFGESMTRTIEALEEGGTPQSMDGTMANLHLWSGIAILGLVIVRLVVRLSNRAPEHSGGTTSVFALAASAMHWLFYALLVAVPISGLLTYNGIADLGEIHSLAKPAFVVLVAAHALAALVHQFILRDGTLTRMLKPRRP